MAEKKRRSPFRDLEHRPEEERFAGMIAILYTILVALDHPKAERIATVFESKLSHYPISEPIAATYLRGIVEEAMKDEG